MPGACSWCECRGVCSLAAGGKGVVECGVIVLSPLLAGGMGVAEWRLGGVAGEGGRQHPLLARLTHRATAEFLPRPQPTIDTHQGHQVRSWRGQGKGR